jgi:rod shape-determining protein MreC
MSKKNIYLTLLILIFAAAVMFSPAKMMFRNTALTIFETPAKTFYSGGKKIGSFFSSISRISHLRKENAELSDKISSLEIDQSKITELEHENSLLKNELGYAETNQSESLLPARIVFRDPTSFFEYIKVDKGKNDGVKAGQAVISNGALVGQVSQVYDSESEVTLITSKDSLILAMLQDSRATGALRGGISGLVLEDVAQDVKYSQGEYVITSGLDETLKPGILIGRASGVHSSKSDLFQSITIEPIVDLSRLELVFIIR